MKAPYSVWGYTDEEPVKERCLVSYHSFKLAKRYAETNGMVTTILDDNGEIVWEREK